MLARLIRDLGLPKRARVLDIGTSTGTNLRLLRDLGFESFEGIDTSDEAIRWCADKGLGTVSKGDVCNMPFPQATFDLVLATDIIEHVESDVLALTEIRRVLKPSAPVIVTVPAFRMLWGLQDEVAHHKRRYRGKELRKLLKDSGLACQKSFYFNYLLLLPIFFTRQLIKVFGVKLQSENELNSPVLNAILTKIFALDVWLAPLLRIPLGVSFLAVAHRVGERGEL